MIKKSILFLSALSCFIGAANAQQHCFTDEVTARAKEAYPEIEQYEARLKADIEKQLIEKGLLKMSKGTDFNDTATLHVPVVFHIVHDYEPDVYLTDDQIRRSLDYINMIFNKENPDTADVIGTFKGKIPGTQVPYIGKAKIRFHLATKDPLGQPTIGITRRLSNLSNFASDQAKFDQWGPHAYLNIWIIKDFNANHASAGAYAYKPATAAQMPHADGVICLARQRDADYTLGHEIGHVFNLDHTWGGTNSPGVDCNGDDDVDDTPPTKGHTTCSTGPLYDTECIYHKDDLLGRIGIKLDSNQVVADYQNNVGVTFNTLIDQVYIDTVHFYPTDSGKPYEIVLKKGNTVIGTYSGVTTDNKYNVVMGKQTYNTANAVYDNNAGVGIKFRVYDSVRLNSVRFYTPASSYGEPYEIVLKRQGTVINSYSGVVATTSTQVVPLNFKIVSNDSTIEYSLEFAVNPGAARDTIIASTQTYEPFRPGVLNMYSTTTNGLYNYFYNWNVSVYNYEEKAVVNFLLPTRSTTANGAYSIEFSNNPGAKRDAISTGTTIIDNIPDVIELVNYEDNGMYNYFYKIKPRYGYYKRYSPAMAMSLFGDSTITYVNYPDTTNTQNVMDYSFCAKMFTHLQTVRMRAALQSSMANRSNLISPANLALTGALDPTPDLSPIADFTVTQPFVCGDNTTNVTFRNRSWRDTVTNLTWVIKSGGNVDTIHSTTVNYNATSATKAFSNPGWVSVSLTATSNKGSHTITKEKAIFVADMNAINPNGYLEEFTPGGTTDKYAMFNYFENDFKWEYVDNVGCYDNKSIRYKGFDERTGTATRLGSPEGDYDDLITPAFDLSAYATSANCNLSFMSAGAFRTAVTADMTDELEVYYNRTCNTLPSSSQWVLLGTLKTSKIGNNGTVTTSFVPAGPYQWTLNSIPIPPAARGQRVFFRFRYRPGIGTSPLAITGLGTGNNFYMDRIQITDFPLGVDTRVLEDKNIALAPNPTTGSTSVVLKNVTGKTMIQVTDITGKLVFRSEYNLQDKISRIEIPAEHIAVKGVYLVQVISGNMKQTEKLVVH